MEKMNFKTNWHRIPLTHGFQLPAGQRKEFDYLEEDEFAMREFFKYRGVWYDLGNFLRIPEGVTNHFEGWEGYSSESFFSGIVIKFVPGTDFEEIVAATYYF